MHARRPKLRRIESVALIREECQNVGRRNLAAEALRLSPASINPEIAIAALRPMTGLPGRSLVGSLLVVAGKPSPLAPSPSPMTRLPIDSRTRHGRDGFDHRLRWRIRWSKPSRPCRVPLD